MDFSYQQFSYQQHTLTITLTKTRKITPYGAAKLEDEEEHTRVGMQLYVSSGPDTEPKPTGLGYYVDDQETFERYYPTLLSRGVQLGKFPLPTVHLTKKLLEHLYASDPLIDWTMEWSALCQHYEEVRVKDVCKEAWRAATTEDLVGLENANHTLNHLFSNWGKFLSQNMDREYYERLVEARDLIAMLRRSEQEKERARMEQEYE